MRDWHKMKAKMIIIDKIRSFINPKNYLEICEEFDKKILQFSWL